MFILKRIIFVLLFSQPALAAFYDPILEQIKPGSITIIGETHKHAESVELFQNLAVETLSRYRCVVIGLEIGSDQQPLLDAAMQGKASVNEITLWPPLDHSSFRLMIEQLARFKQQGECIKVIAIDSGRDNIIDRDVWMALSLAEQVGDKPILVLLGGLHTLKQVKWTIKSGQPSVAEILTNRGFRVKSFPQRWQTDRCTDNQLKTGVFINNQSPQALTLLNKSLLSLIKAKPEQSVSDVVDGFVVWTCAGKGHKPD